MTHRLPLLLALGLGLAAAPALAAPALKPSVDTAQGVVTVGDMFADAGDLASQPLFLAPAPGTTGNVPLDQVRLAAARAGLADFDPGSVTAVHVSRLATPVGPADLVALLTAELRSRGVLTADMSLDAAFDTSLEGIEAAAVAQPVRLVNLRYAPDSGTFSARFALAGIAAPLDLGGRIDLAVEAPELATTLAAGTILKPSDIVMQPVPLRLVQNGNVATMDQLVGRQLQRQSRAGMLLKTSDVADPQLVGRNDLVTVYLHAGTMTLTIKGSALNAASLGQPVAVLNPVSKRIVHGIARADGAVEISTAPQSVAGL